MKVVTPNRTKFNPNTVGWGRSLPPPRTYAFTSTKEDWNYSFDAANDPSNADSTPLLFSSIFNVTTWFNSVWGCGDWLQWLQANVAKYGVDAAKITFLKYWNQNSDTAWVNGCTLQQDFNNYCTSIGLDITGILSNSVVGTENLVTNIGSAVGSAVGAVGSTAKTIKTIIPFVIVGVVLLTGFIIYKNFAHSGAVGENVGKAIKA